MASPTSGAKAPSVASRQRSQTAGRSSVSALTRTGFSGQSYTCVPADIDKTLPSIAGQPQSGETFSADPGRWTGNPTSFTYQWQRCDAAGAN